MPTTLQALHELSPTWKLDYWPKANPGWTFFYLIKTVAGPQRTITGHIVDCPGLSCWSGSTLTPRFASVAGADAWAKEIGLHYQHDPQYTPLCCWCDEHAAAIVGGDLACEHHAHVLHHWTRETVVITP